MTRRQFEKNLNDPAGSGLSKVIRRIRIIDAKGDSRTRSDGDPNVKQDVRRKMEFFRQQLLEQGWSDPCSTYAWSPEEGEFVLPASGSADGVGALGAAIIYNELSEVGDALSDAWFFARMIVEGTAFLHETGNARDLALARFYTNLTLWETQRAHAKKALAGRKSLEGAASGREQLSRRRSRGINDRLSRMEELYAAGKGVSESAAIVARQMPGQSKEANRKLWYRHRKKV